jgi:DNA polymerase-3 subunit alpha (Gram-positive type)
VNAALRESLYDLYEQGGLELYLAGTGGLKRDLIIRLETSALTPEKAEIIQYYAVNRWDDEDEFDEYARPHKPLPDLAEEITGITNQQLVRCRLSSIVIDDFRSFIDGAELSGHNLEFCLGLLNL